MDESKVIIGFVLLLGLCIWGAVASENAWQEKKKQEYESCISKGETEYTCKSYIASLEAKRSADSAAMMSAAAMGMAASNNAMNSYRR